jgi:hypothetical protein
LFQPFRIRRPRWNCVDASILRILLLIVIVSTYRGDPGAATGAMSENRSRDT